MKISTIIPVHNCARFLGEAIQSVLDQSHQPDQIIVVDDGSTDSSPSIAASFSEIMLIKQENSGPSAARNAGIKAAMGDFITFLDCDDKWLPEKLATQVEYHTKHATVDISFTHMRNEKWHDLPDQDWAARLLEDDVPGIFAGTLMVRKSTFLEVGLYDSDFDMGENAEWFARAVDKNIRHFVIPETLYIRRIHGSNMSGNTNLARSTVLKAIRAKVKRSKDRPEP